jgi:NAD(P)-dependent dehydrogenase (short-subunit alcohol dehydrogenase family)
MKFDFSGQVALVTGGTRGLGKQIADDLFNLGSDLIITGTNSNHIKELNHTLVPEKRKRVKYIAADFRDAENIKQFTKQIMAYERIDVCVNNAGINRINYIDETLLEDWDDIITVNLKAPFMIIREAAKIMKKRNYGRIVNISSIFGVVSRAKRSIYSTSKFGLRGLTLAVANELAKYNILVNSVSPGFVLTELTKRILTGEEMTELADQVPIRRFAMPDEISRVVIFLASSLNTYIAGQNIIVDGGYVNV